ncbi:MAG TPA: hypothetical protein VMG12_23285 [Polyangiaceae bacterium]|nr:hypothetical protein [Polyangiaceae bacterium]
MIRSGSKFGVAAFAALGAAVSVGAALFATAPAFAKSLWWDEARIGVKVHDHAFHRVTANAIGCDVRVRLYFDAPYAGYQEPAPERNHFRFSAQVTLSDDQTFVSETFDNTEPGARVFAFSHDSKADGCWGEREHSLRKVDVHACRGVGCVPEPFE